MTPSKLIINIIINKCPSQYNASIIDPFNFFSVINNRIPSKQFYVSVVPDYVTITYTVSIFTNYVEQNNKIIEAVEFASDSYWGDPKRFQFRAMIDSFTLKTELADKAERVVSSTFSIKLHGHIVPDIPQKDLTSLKKLPGINKITVNENISGEN